MIATPNLQVGKSRPWEAKQTQQITQAGQVHKRPWFLALSADLNLLDIQEHLDSGQEVSREPLGWEGMWVNGETGEERAVSVYTEDEQSGQPSWQRQLESSMYPQDLCHWALMLAQY